MKLKAETNKVPVHPHCTDLFCCIFRNIKALNLSQPSGKIHFQRKKLESAHMSVHLTFHFSAKCIPVVFLNVRSSSENLPTAAVIVFFTMI